MHDKKYERKSFRLEEMIPYGNLNPHKERKNTSKYNYVRKYQKN